MRNRALLRSVVGAAIAAVCCAMPLLAVAGAGRMACESGSRADPGDDLLSRADWLQPRHPYDFANGSVWRTYDLIVIGTGTAAQVVAGRVRRAGRAVAMVDLAPLAAPVPYVVVIPRKCWSAGLNIGRNHLAIVA